MGMMALAILLFLVIFQLVVIGELQGECDDAYGFADYWRGKTDSLFDVSHSLRMQVYDLKDSIFVMKHGYYD